MNSWIDPVHVRLVRALALALVASIGPAAHAQPLDVPPLTLDAAVARALDANPALVAARLRRAVDRAGVAVARERPNPEFRAEFERETPRQSYGVGLPLELGGKRGARIAVGEATVATGEAELQRMAADVRDQARRAYFAVVAAEGRLAILREVRDLAARAHDAARQRFDAGTAPRLEVLQASLALAQADNDVVVAESARAAARVQLNALLAWPLDAPARCVTPIDAGAVPGAGAAVGLARSASVELTLIARRIDEQHARIALARAVQVPDVTPEAAITRDAEPEFDTGWRAAVGLTVPLFTRHRAGVQLEQAALAQLEAERAAIDARIVGDVSAAATIAAAGRRQFDRYAADILPQALEVERMAEDSYRLGQTGVAALLQALQSTREARLRALQAGADLQNAVADLERAIGAPLP